MKKSFLIITMFCLFVIQVYSQQIKIDWVKHIGGPADDDAMVIAVDKDKNVYSSGIFEGLCDFSDTIMNPINGRAFLVKYDSLGNMKWHKQIKAWQAYGIATDQQGNVFITGTFRDTAIFGNDTLRTYPGGNDLYLAKFDSVGNNIWAKKAGNSHFSSVGEVNISWDLKSDNAGNVYMMGEFYNLQPFWDSTLAVGKFIAKVDNNGNLNWVREKAFSTFMSIDNENNIYVGGNENINHYVIFNTDTFNLDTAGSYIVKFDSDANVLWVKPGGRYVYEITTDNESIYALMGGLYKFYMYKYDKTGNPLWQKPLTGHWGAVWKSLICDTLGHIYIANIDTNFVTVYDSSFNIICSSVKGNEFNLTTDNYKNIYTVGGLYGTHQFENTTLTSWGSEDIFIAKFNFSNNVGIEEPYIKEGIKVSPNPFTNEFTVSLPENAGNTEISIFDLTGRALKQLRMNNEKSIIDLSDLAKGVYFISAKGKDDFNSFSKIVKQ